MSEKNIQHAWQEVSLFLFNPSVVLSKITLPTEAIQSNSRLSTAQGPAPLSEFTTLSLVMPLQLSKTPHNVTEVAALLNKIKDRKIKVIIGLEKLAKVAEFSLAKVTVVETKNRDLVDVGKEAQKKKH